MVFVSQSLIDTALSQSCSQALAIPHRWEWRLKTGVTRGKITTSGGNERPELNFSSRCKAFPQIKHTLSKIEFSTFCTIWKTCVVSSARQAHVQCHEETFKVSLPICWGDRSPSGPWITNPADPSSAGFSALGDRGGSLTWLACPQWAGSISEQQVNACRVMMGTQASFPFPSSISI